jgi:4,5:9,10-diseco-3-hydroxy-5,9,17-trioxoandrosta-1(10),2-diene-4-oate hydrolase
MSVTKSSRPAGRHFQVNGQAIHLIECGSGIEPLVLLHGGGPGASGWSNFHANVAALGAQYRLFIPDLPGYGLSGKEPIEGPRYAHYGKAIVGVLDQLGIAKAHLIGNSLGGGTALSMALNAPERVDKLILMGPAGLVSAYGTTPTEGARMIFEYYGGTGPSREKLSAFIRLMVYDASAMTAELLEERFAASIEPDILANPPLGKDRPPILEELWRDPRLARLPHETLVLWGRNDRVNPLHTAEILLNQLPSARFLSFTKCGHWVQYERAKEFNTAVLAFLAGNL